MKGKYLITTENWFIAPDGKYYRAVWGETEVLTDDFLGIKTNRNSVNWYVKIGSDTNHVIIAGCQVNYAIKCDVQPNNNRVVDFIDDSVKGFIEQERPTQIYIVL